MDKPALAAKTTVVKGLLNDVGGAGNGHDHGFCGLYSGYRSAGTFNDPWGSGISIDQHLRQTLSFHEPYPTLNCGVLASDTPPFKAHRRSFSYRAARQQIPTEFDPYRLYARFFGLGTGDPGVLAGDPGGGRPAAAAPPAERAGPRADRSEVDPSAPGRLDAAKLDAPRDCPARDGRAGCRRRSGRGPIGRPSCTRVSGPDEGLDPRDENNVPALVALMLDLVALALSCQLSRIVTFQFGHAGEKWYFRWLWINENSHDDIAHRDNGKDPVAAEKLLRINVWYAQQVSRLAAAWTPCPRARAPCWTTAWWCGATRWPPARTAWPTFRWCCWARPPAGCATPAA